MTEAERDRIRTFPFRPWIRSTSRRAMVWGVGVVAVLGLAACALRGPDSAPLARAFGTLGGYGLLFWLSLLKVWWTAGKPAVVVDGEGIAYQPLHLFKLRTIPFAKVVSCAPRKTTESLRLIHEWRPGEGREFFLNLAVIAGRHELLDLLGERLAAAGLEPVAGEKHSWRRPGWEPDQ